MSDYDESFDDSFDSASDSDHPDGDVDSYFQTVSSRNHGSINPMAFAVRGGGGGGSFGLEVPYARKDFQLPSGNGARAQFESLSDHDDWRYGITKLT